MCRTLMIFALLPLLQGCDDVPRPIGVGPHLADSSVGSRGSRYRSVTGDARDYRVVTPRPWGEVNQEVAPKKK